MTASESLPFPIPDPDSPQPLGLYVHVPFCEQHCHYCTFPIAVLPESEHAGYVSRLAAELEMAWPDAQPSTVYLGGGTPSLLAPDLLRRVLEPITAAAVEVTMEANPGTLDDVRIRAAVECGVNRVSVGAQSFDPGELREAGRLHTPRDTWTDVERLRRHGVGNISIDLIAGLPRQQSSQTWTSTLDSVLELDPEHVSVYMLELEDSALWSRQAARDPDRFGFPDDDRMASMALEADDRLSAAGYVHYEISSWAKPGRECRHNVGYWTGIPYRGIGLGAHSFLGEERFWNIRAYAGYAAALDQGALPVAGRETRTPRHSLEEGFLVGLRRLDGFDVRKLESNLRIEFPHAWYERVDRLVEAGFIRFDDPVLRLTRRGWLVASAVAEELLCPELLSICEATR